MPKTLLQIVNTAQAELGLPQSATVVGNTDPTTVQMLALLNFELDELRSLKLEGWTVLQTEFNLVVEVPIETTGTLTPDSPIITDIPDTTGLEAQFWQVITNGVPAGGTRILSVDSTTQVTLNMEAIVETTTSASSIIFAKDTYELPEAFDRYIGNTWWDRTNYWALFGPDSPQLDQLHRSGIFTTGPRRHFRQIGPYTNRYRIWPPPAELVNPLQLVFEYISKHPVLDVTATVQPTFIQYFTADSQTPLLDDRALIMGLKWRFWAQKGLNWVPLRTDYKRYVSKLMARDGGNTTKSLVRSPTPYLIDSAQVQDGFFPGPGLPGYTGTT